MDIFIIKHKIINITLLAKFMNLLFKRKIGLITQIIKSQLIDGKNQ